MGDIQQTVSTPPPVVRKGHRLWLPIGIVILAASVIAYALSQQELEGNFKNMYLVMVSMLTILLLGIWFLFLSRFRWRTRLLGLGVAILFFAAFEMTVRVDGAISGAGMPRLVWKWTPRMDADLPPLATTDLDKAIVDVRTPHPADYPQFLGPHRDAILEGVHLAADWRAQPPRQLWRQPIGVGWSAFAVVGNAAITQEQRGPKELTVCYDIRNGQVLWTHENPVRLSDPQGGDGPRATPTIVDGRVYAYGGTGVLDCLDGGTGRVLWSHDVLGENKSKNLIWGKSSSPLIADDLVVVTGGDAGGPSLIAYHKKDGKPAWTAGQEMSAYASPLLATLAGKRQIVIINAVSVTGHDLADGHILWRYQWPGDWPKATQPVPVGDDRLLISASYGQGAALLQVRAGSEGPFNVSEVWRSRNLKTQFSNNIVRDGVIYGLDDGVLTGVDVESGKRLWKNGRYGYGQLLLAGDLLLVQAEKPGDIVLVKADRHGMKELGRLPALAAKTWNHPVLAPPYLLVRNDQEAICFELPMDPTVASAGKSGAR